MRPLIINKLGGGVSGPTNVASQARGATASSSSETNSLYYAYNANNGVRHTNNNWGGTPAADGGGWNSAANPSVAAPEWLQVEFSTSKTIVEIDVITIADAINYNTNPTLTDTFASYGIVDFKVQYWNGTAWVDQTTVAANNKVWRQFTFAAVTTTKIRVLITAALGGYARLVELEAWTA